MGLLLHDSLYEETTTIDVVCIIKNNYIITVNSYPHNYIRKYGSTFYVGIAMVVFPYFGPWEN